MNRHLVRTLKIILSQWVKCEIVCGKMSMALGEKETADKMLGFFKKKLIWRKAFLGGKELTYFMKSSASVYWQEKPYWNV